MHDPGDLARLAAGIPVATLLPWSLPRIARSRRLGPVVAAACAAVVAAPLLPAAAGWIVLATPPAALALTGRLRRDEATETDFNTPTLAAALPLLASAVLATVIPILALDASELWTALRTAVDSNAFIVAASGALAAIFLGGWIVSWVLAPFAAALAKEETPNNVSSLKHAGTLIGWFERALFFALLAGGAPEAAAVALTAKSVARFPLLSKHEEGFAEYFLIGTLASLVVAMSAAVAVRAALGLSAF